MKNRTALVHARTRRGHVVTALVMASALAVAGAPAQGQLTEEAVRAYVWSVDDAARSAARATIERDSSNAALTLPQMRQLEEWVRLGNNDFVERADTGAVIHKMTVSAPGDREIPLLIRVPRAYTPERAWPLLLAMHGGPTGDASGALQGAANMLQVWTPAAEAAGWIVASPAMVDVVARDGRTADRLPYEIFHPEEARSVLDVVREAFHVDPDRIVSTGISLGSNFSIAFAAAHPDWFSAIVPVSTEGESREWLLRNLEPVPSYVLQGAQDRNVRAQAGPRAMDRILTDFGYDHVFREFSDRAHEGFQEHYPDVLEWLSARPRNPAPDEILRVPHMGIVTPARRIHWIEVDTRQALLQARITGQIIDITVRWAGQITLYLNDRLVDLDQPVTIRLNGQHLHTGRYTRSTTVALDEARASGDTDRLYPARASILMPGGGGPNPAALALSEQIAPRSAPGQLSFWESYAVTALEERFPTLGFTAAETELAENTSVPEQVALRVTGVDANSAAANAGLEVGDVIIRFADELIFRGRGGTDSLYDLLVRELRETPTAYDIVVARGGSVRALRVRYQLGPYVN